MVVGLRSIRPGEGILTSETFQALRKHLQSHQFLDEPDYPSISRLFG